MEQNFINASVSPQSHTFRFGGQPAVFKVTVINDSEQHADFKLEVIPAGASPSSANQWYYLSPEISAAKPPGSSTEFKIIIFDSPIPGFVGTASLRIRIVSPRLRQERTLVVHLRIEADDRVKSVSVELPVRQFQVYPSNSVNIPVRVRNSGPKPVDVVLRLAGIEPSWLNNGAERRLLLEANAQIETAFECKPATVTQALSREYPFTIEATSRDGYPSNIQGSLEVLPVGFVEFSATPQQQTIPRRGWWFPDWKSNSATFQLLFKNVSNLQQQVDIQLQGRNHRQCSFKVSPENAELALGETSKVTLEVKTKRPWVGWLKTLRFDTKAILSDQRLGGTDPTTQTLELKVLPILPLWLQLALIALLALLLSLPFSKLEEAHTDSINVVRFSADASTAVSGSNDSTIRRWRVNGNSLEAEGETEPQKPKGVLGKTNGEVFSLRFDPHKNNRVAAGMKNSVIQLWNVAKREKEAELKVPGFVGKTDKAFDLVFTQNDKRYLISGHPNGKVLVWVRNYAIEEFQPQPERFINIDYEVNSMALSRDDKTLAVAGNLKSLTLLDLDKLNRLPKNNQNLTKDDLVKLNLIQGQFSVADANSAYGNNDRIFSVAFAPENSNILATADSDGYITILDYQCQSSKADPKQPLYKEECQRDRRKVGERAVRSIVFSNDGKKLVSASDDGRVIVWQLTPEGTLSTEAVKGKEIAKRNHLINSIDINSQGNMVIIGGEECQKNQNGKKCKPQLIPLD
jgi:WD40 repeat protein